MKSSMFCKALMMAVVMSVSGTAYADQGDQLFSVEVIQQTMTFQRKDIASAELIKVADDNYGVKVVLTSAAADKLYAMTSQYKGKQVNIVSRKKEILATVVIETGLGGEFIVSNMDESGAKEVVKTLTS